MPDASYSAEGLINTCAAHSKHFFQTTEHLSAGQQKNLWII